MEGTLADEFLFDMDDELDDLEGLEETDGDKPGAVESSGLAAAAGSRVVAEDAAAGAVDVNELIRRSLMGDGGDEAMLEAVGNIGATTDTASNGSARTAKSEPSDTSAPDSVSKLLKKADSVNELVKLWGSRRLDRHMRQVYNALVETMPATAVAAPAATTSSTTSDPPTTYNSGDGATELTASVLAAAQDVADAAHQAWVRAADVTPETESAVAAREDRALDMQANLLSSGGPSAGGSGTVEDDPHYTLIVRSNQLVAEIDEEIAEIHRLVRDLYSSKFSELESLVLNAMDYVRVVKAIGNEMDVTKINLSELLPANTVMVVSVTATTSTGKPLTEDALKRALDACDVALLLDQCKSTAIAFVESRMTSVAPNLTAIVGASVAAKLIASAGGLAVLSRMPSSSVQSLGSKKRTLAGLSAAGSGLIPRTGFMAECDLLKRTPPDLRIRMCRVLGGRCALAARVDAFLEDPSGSVGRRFADELQAKLDKWQEPPPAKKVKALTAPADKAGRKRGGRRVRRLKEKYAQSELRKQANRVEFGKVGDYDGDDGDTTALGMLGGASGSGRLRVMADSDIGRIGGLNKNKRGKAGGLSAAAAMAASSAARNVSASYAAGGQTSGLASSVAFSTVQGLELENPLAFREKKKQENMYFASDAGFANSSTMPLSKKPKIEGGFAVPQLPLRK